MEEFQFAALSMMVLAIIGIMINITAIYLAIKLSLFRNSFGYHVLSYLAAGTGVNIIYLFWGVPVTFLKVPQDGGEFMDAVPGQLVQFFWFSSIYTQISTAINRLVAIYWPSEYVKSFTNVRTLCVLGSVWFIGFAQSFIFRLDGCAFIFSSVQYSWTYQATPCGAFLQVAYDLWFNVGLGIILFFLNIIVIYRIHTTYIRPRGNITEMERRRRVKNEIKFFIQSFFVSSLIILVNVTFNVFPSFNADSRVYVYITTTVFWQIFLICEGLTPFIFNHEFRRISDWPCSVCKTKTLKYILKKIESKRVSSTNG